MMKTMPWKFLSTCMLLLTAYLLAACSNSQAGGTPSEQSRLDEGIESNLNENAMIALKSGFDHAKYFPNESGTTGYYYLEAKAAKFSPSDSKRTALNLSVVIDRSGSMEGDKLDNAKRAAKFIVNQLAEEDYISIVMYDDEVKVVAASAKVGDKEALRRKIDGIEAGGSTNLGGGMQEGYSQVKSTYKQGFINRVLLLSDGLVNVGITDQSELQRIAKNKNLEDGITISTFGIGLDFNEDLMTGLSEYGSGNYYFIKNPDEIPAIFEKELKGLLNVVAQNAVLTIDLPEGTVLEKVFGYKFEQSGNRVIVNFRDIFSEETKAIMVRFNVQERSRAQFEFKATLSYNDATTEAKSGKQLETRDVLSLAETQLDRDKSISESIMAQVVLFESNDKLEEAMREADKGNYSRAREVTEMNAVYLKNNDDYVRASPELQRQEENNTSYGAGIKDAESMSPSEFKTVQKSSKSMNYEVRKKK